MTPRQIQKRLGLAPGETLVKLVAACEAVDPIAPHRAFDALSLTMPWLGSGKTDGEVTPPLGSATVHPFASAGDGVGFGLLVEHRRNPDGRPIVRMSPARATIVAPNLHAFLGLVAVAGSARAVERDRSDAEWHALGRAVCERRAWLVDRLRAVVGVELPSCPSEITNAIPEPEDGAPLQKIPGPITTAEDPNAAVAIGRWALHAGRLEHAAGHARNAMAGKAHDAALAASILVLALVRLGRSSEAVAPLSALVEEWLDPQWRTPPRVHPRRLVAREEMLRMLAAVPVRDAASLVARVKSAPLRVEDPADFF